jgi:hypothetical protein
MIKKINSPICSYPDPLGCLTHEKGQRGKRLHKTLLAGNVLLVLLSGHQFASLEQICRV